MIVGKCKKGLSEMSIVRERIRRPLPPSELYILWACASFAKTDGVIRGFRSRSELSTKLGRSGGPTGLHLKIGLNLHAELCLEAISN